MQQYTHFFAWLSICLITTSCAQIKEEDTIWQPKSYPVVFSIISPQHKAQVTLNKTVTLTETNNTITYPSAKIYISNDQQSWVELTRKSVEDAIYTDNNEQLDITEGRTYYLRVELPEATLTAKTTVPLQQAAIIDASYQINTYSTSENYYYGTLNTNVKLPQNYQCLMTASTFFIGNTATTFIQNSSLTENLNLPDSISSFEINLISLDSFLSTYIVAQKISSRMIFSEGDLSVFIGTYNGVLPKYSNINNGVGLFGSYTTTSKTVNVTNP